jgi:mono/diheme cytochrome c family protein
VYRTLREGKRGTPMAGWKAVLDEQQSWDVVGYLLGVGREASGARP